MTHDYKKLFWWMRIASSLFLAARSYYVKQLSEILKPIVVAAVFINIFLFFFGLATGLDDIQILAIINVIFLSFALLQEENK